MSEINAAGAAYAVEAEQDVYADMTDDATRVTWTDAGLAAFLESLRRLYGDDFVDRLRLARIESDARAGDTPAVVGDTTDCPQCCAGPEFITGAEIIRGVRYYRLRCHHLVKA